MMKHEWLQQILSTNVLYFLTCAEYGTTLSAARRLGLSQSALSRAIQKFESDLGYRVFERLARGLALTPRGKTLHTFLLNATDSWEREWTHQQGEPLATPPLRVGCVSHVVLKFLLAGGRPPLGNPKPTVQAAQTVQFFSGRSLQLVEEVRNSLLDFAFISLNTVPTRLVKHIRVRSEPVAIVGLRQKFPGLSQVRTVKDLRRFPLVALPAPTVNREHVLQSGQNGFVIDDPYTLRELILNGWAVGEVQLDFFSHSERKQLISAPLKAPHHGVATYAIYRDDLKNSKFQILTSWVELIRSRA